jgi:hypothetical protein
MIISKYKIELVSNHMAQEDLNTSIVQTLIEQVILHLIGKQHRYKYICDYLFKEKFHLLSVK